MDFENVDLYAGMCPPGMDPSMFMAMNRLKLFMKAIDEVLVRTGICESGEVAKIARRSEALEALDGVNSTRRIVQEQMNMLRDEEREKMQSAFEESEMKAALDAAEQKFTADLAELLED